MKVVHFFDGSKFFYAEVPYFEWDIEGAKYLMSGADNAHSALCWTTGTDQEQCEQVKSVLDLVYNLRARFNYKTNYNNPIPECVNKGYDKYCDVLDNIATNLAAELYCLISLPMTDDEKKKSYYRDKISAYELEAYRLLGELKEGKISYTLKDGKTRTFDYIYTTSNELDYRGMLFYAPETREIKNFEDEVERKIFKR